MSGMPNHGSVLRLRTLVYKRRINASRHEELCIRMMQTQNEMRQLQEEIDKLDSEIIEQIESMDCAANHNNG